MAQATFAMSSRARRTSSRTGPSTEGGEGGRNTRAPVPGSVFVPVRESTRSPVRVRSHQLPGSVGLGEAGDRGHGGGADAGGHLQWQEEPVVGVLVRERGQDGV